MPGCCATATFTVPVGSFFAAMIVVERRGFVVVYTLSKMHATHREASHWIQCQRRHVFLGALHVGKYNDEAVRYVAPEGVLVHRVLSRCAVTEHHDGVWSLPGQRRMQDEDGYVVLRPVQLGHLTEGARRVQVSIPAIGP